MRNFYFADLLFLMSVDVWPPSEGHMHCTFFLSEESTQSTMARDHEAARGEANLI